MPLKGIKIGFLGGGQMAGAMLKGLVGSGVVAAGDLYVTDINRERLDYLRESLGVNIIFDNRELVHTAEILILSVKPGLVPAVLREVAEVIRPGQLLISIAAGVSTAALSGAAGKNAAVIRVMPNTPALVGEAASALCLGPGAGGKDMEKALAIFSSFGRAVEVPESLMDAVTGLSGSGPAYMFLILEALADAGVKMGIPREAALLLAVQTMLGSARMVLETGLHPAQLKDMVTTPGGTTIEGLFSMEKDGIRGILMKAVESATVRSREMCGGLK
ncbi:MAG: pyrroline-5-carboxylate reductase [Bacillota bacterium]